MNFAYEAIFFILLLLVFAAVFVFIERLLELRRAQVDWQDFVKGVFNVLASGNEAEALAICEDTPVPVANIAATAIRHRNGTLFALREAVDAQGRAEVGRLTRRLASLAIIGQTAPMVGLLGTIFGFVRTLTPAEGVEIATRSVLVSQAVSSMLMAAGGLSVAIVVAVMHAALRMRLDRLVSDLEAAATDIVGTVHRKGGEA